VETLVPLREVRADKRLEIYFADRYILIVKKRPESADMAGMKMGYRDKIKIYLPAGSFFQIPRRMFRVLRVAAVNESESVAALKKNAVRAPGVEKMDTLALRRDRDILVLRGNGRIFCRLDDLYCRWLEFIFLSEFFDEFGKILYCHILQPFREFILSCAARQRTASKAEHIRPA